MNKWQDRKVTGVQLTLVALGNISRPSRGVIYGSALGLKYGGHRAFQTAMRVNRGSLTATTCSNPKPSPFP